MAESLPLLERSMLQGSEDLPDNYCDPCFDESVYTNNWLNTVKVVMKIYVGSALHLTKDTNYSGITNLWKDRLDPIFNQLSERNLANECV